MRQSKFLVIMNFIEKVVPIPALWLSAILGIYSVETGNFLASGGYFLTMFILITYWQKI